MVADGAAEHGITSLKCVEHRTLRDWSCDFESHLAANVRQVAKMGGKDNANHDNSHDNLLGLRPASVPRHIEWLVVRRQTRDV